MSDQELISETVSRNGSESDIDDICARTVCEPDDFRARTLCEPELGPLPHGRLVGNQSLS